VRLDKQTAIVTGGGSGFGEGIAKRFAEEGARVIVADINPEGAERVASEITAAGGVAAAVSVDVSVSDQVGAMVASALELHGRLDILVNNAGITHKNQPMLDVDEATFDRVFAVNVKSIYLGAQHAVPVFRRQGGGTMINVASTAGVRPRPGLTWYNASKGAVIVATKSMAVELAPENIRVNAVNPVAGDTPLLKDFMPGEDTPEIRAKFIATIPMGRFSQALDIARACLFLASEDAEFITGVCLEVDGGRCI
jgi:3-oxoacyl-[acyl-carrier protein] reductase